ncbi:hypothetical protein G7046_g7557 [Stylonectria norvegica]|nr:hypothetical protein G7046_g7557 [Stylonectria norvegica]
MLCSILFAVWALLVEASAFTIEPREPKRKNYEILDKAGGLPVPLNRQIRVISSEAGGKLPKGPLPKNLSKKGIAAFQLILLNEFFEVAYFEALRKNVTKKRTGFELGYETALRTNGTRYENNQTRAEIRMEQNLNVLLNQEKMHAIAAQQVLKANHAVRPPPCRYRCHVNNLEEALRHAETFTAVGMGVLQTVSVILSEENQSDVVRILSSIIGQEGEQNGYFRELLGYVPTEAPFLTNVPLEYAYSVLQRYTLQCSYTKTKIEDDFTMTKFPTLDVEDQEILTMTANETSLKFVASLDHEAIKKLDQLNISQARPVPGQLTFPVPLPKDKLFMTYLNGQRMHSVDLEEGSLNDSILTTKASFPCKKENWRGLTIAALTTTNKFADYDELVNNTIAGPGLIQADILLVKVTGCLRVEISFSFLGMDAVSGRQGVKDVGEGGKVTMAEWESWLVLG